MISMKQMICTYCDQDIIIRNSVRHIMFPNKQEISLKQLVTRSTIISCIIKMSYLYSNAGKGGVKMHIIEVIIL